jgi:pimeloyl-ACP methyl ester carboxylesterase
MPEQMAKRDSWVDYASKEGYATISYDRLGSGQSFRADPSLEVQFNLQAEIAHEIAKLLRNGVVGGKQFSKVVYIGHSLGSMVGTIATQRHTDDFDAVVLTGWSSTVVEGFVKIAVGLPIPAALVNPVKWGDLHPGYLAFTGQDIQRKNFYGPEGSFDPAVENHDWENRDTAALGEFLTTFEGMTLSPYVKPVQVIIGEFDYLLCPSGKCANGSTNVPGNARSVFPNSSNFTTFIVPGTGHSLNLHYSAVETFRVAHDFLQYNIE